MSWNTFENVCLFHILDGLRDGLTHYSGPSRAALIYSLRADGPLHIYDPQNLMQGHSFRLGQVFLESDKWRKMPPEGPDVVFFDDEHLRDLQMSGIICYGGRSRAVPYQVWFTEEHRDMCNTGPTKRWLEYAVRLFSQNFEMQSVMSIDTAGYVLQQCSNHALRDFLVDERSEMGRLDTQLRVYPILDAVLGISKTLEEGAWPRGRLAFVEPSVMEHLNFMAMFPDHERPKLADHKHVRKLLQSVEGQGRMLVSNGSTVVGIAAGRVPDSSIVADFHGSHGFLYLNEIMVCSFADGTYSSSTRKANLVELEELIFGSTLDLAGQNALMRVVAELVDSAAQRSHGCTLVLDFGDRALEISGQYLVHRLDLKQQRFMDLAKSLAKVDGALHISADLKLQGFACLLDGHSVPGENRARGARFNSALRFSAEHEEVIVVVVSSDKPVSVIQGGIELTAACAFETISGCPTPPRLEDWIST